MRMILSNVRKQLELIPEDRLNFRPMPEIRSLGELAVHMHSYLCEGPESVIAGKHVPTEEPVFTSKAELLKWTDRQVKTAYELFAQLTDKQISQTIEAYGEKFPAAKMLSFTMDEVLHHRGQLTVYLRLLGVPPAFIYDFETKEAPVA